MARVVISRPLSTEADFNQCLSCGFYCRDSGTKIVLPPSPPVLPSVRTIPLHLSALSFIYHRHHIILAGVSVIDTLTK